MKQARTLTNSELERVLLVVREMPHAERNRIALLLSFYAGMRVKEVASLRVKDVYEPDGSVKTYILLSPEQTKGKKGRQVVVSKKLKKELGRYLGSLKNGKYGPDSPLIPSQKSNLPFSPNSLCQVFGRIYDKVGITGATSHSGRRTFITQLANKGISVRVIMSLAGHQNLSTTQRYIDVNDALLKSAVEVI